MAGLFKVCLLVLVLTLIVYWLARTNQFDGKLYIPSELFKASPRDSNEIFADTAITTALVLGMMILIRNLSKPDKK